MPNIVGVVKAESLRRATNLARIRNKELIQNFGGNSPSLKSTTCQSKEYFRANIETTLRKMGYGDTNRMKVTREASQSHAMDLRCRTVSETNVIRNKIIWADLHDTVLCRRTSLENRTLNRK